MPKVVICVVPGWAVGGGHSLHVVCDMTIASREHAVFKQTDADVASYDAGYGSAYLARQIGQKRARECASAAGVAIETVALDLEERNVGGWLNFPDQDAARAYVQASRQLIRAEPPPNVELPLRIRVEPLAAIRTE